MRIFRAWMGSNGLAQTGMGLNGLGTGSNGLQREDALSPQVGNLRQSHDNCGSLIELLLVGIRTLKGGEYI
jgi:hypothetical protein